MTLQTILVNAFQEAKSRPDKGNVPRTIHRNRSMQWVEALASQFRQCYDTKHSDIRTFSKQHKDNKTDFGLSEFLYDIHICRVGQVQSAQNDVTLYYVKEALWQIESEFAWDSKQALTLLSAK